jgi:epoxide hydrolase-like predicted phosphatase
MVKAIIFDCFGVLTATDGWSLFKLKYFNHEPSLLEQATSLNKQADAGLITYDDFIREIAGLAGISGQQASVIVDDSSPNPALFDYIAQLKPHYKIGMLSNAAANWLSELFSPAQIALFDATLLSYEAGFIKPQPEIYELMAERLGLEPNECVFIDDQERCTTGAREVGMEAIWYRGFDQMKQELEQLTAGPKN